MAVTNGSSRRDYSIPSLDDILDEKSLEQHKEFVQLIEKQVNTYTLTLYHTMDTSVHFVSKKFWSIITDFSFRGRTVWSQMC